MFCQSCGAQIDAAFAVCPSCGQRQAGTASTDLGEQVKTSSRDAVGVLRLLLLDPVGGLPVAFTSLGAERALSAGIALSIAFALLASGGVVMGASAVKQTATQFLGVFAAGINAPSGFGAFLKISFAFFVLPASLVGVSFVIRKLANASSPVAADVFTAGAALLPLGIAVCLAGVLGVGNWKVALLLFFLAISYLVLMLYAGLTRVGGMSERAGAPAVPGALLFAGVLSKVVLAAFM